jgi:hypothetical protein
MGEATDVAVDHYEKLVTSCEERNAQKLTPVESPEFPPNFVWHDEEFTRLCCHLWYRANHGGCCILGPQYLAFGSDYQGLEFLHRPMDYIAALGDELEKCQSLPLREVLEFEQPPAYVALRRRTIQQMLLAELIAA